ncbi:hypothetical protein CL621_01180 [archaeon]|nr:hypothetical protein [archaeon]|tara:strand:- start:647 stop:1498 length:852 start_codon:yes stop_codon:yes gene_type:complete
MLEDIGPILRSWNPNSEEIDYRKITGEDGKDKIQIRMHGCTINDTQTSFEGIIQFELEGRPDGIKPYNYNFALDYYKEKLGEYIKEHSSDTGFTLDKESCKELSEEGSSVYDRYLFLYQIDDLPNVIKDTEQNMELFKFVGKYASRESDKMKLEQRWPYILRVNGVSKAKLYTNKGEYDLALLSVQETLGKLEDLDEVYSREFEVEKRTSEKILKNVEKIIIRTAPSKLTLLNTTLDAFVAMENYEAAAKVRDAIGQYIEILEKRYEISVIEEQIKEHFPKED